MFRIQSATLFALLTLAGCGGGGSSTPPLVTPTQPVAATELTLSAAGADTYVGGAPVALNAVLNGAGTVAWQLAAGGAGTLSATSGASVSYAPPATSDVNAVAKVSITATSGGLSKTVTLNLLPDANKPGLSLLAGNTSSVADADASVDGVGTAARFTGISGITVDAGGNAYVTENNGSANLLRKIAVDGSVTTVSTAALGIGTLYEAPTPAADGGVYFTKVGNATSREYYYATYKLGSDGTVTFLTSMITTFNGHGGDVLASPVGKVYRLHENSIALWQADGNDQPFVGDLFKFGTLDGAGTAASFTLLKDVTVDKNGTLFALDQGSLRQITPAGVVTTLATFPVIASPTTSATAAPIRIGVDGDDNVLLLYVSQDTSYYEIRKLSGGAIVPLYQVGTQQGPYDIRPSSMVVQRDGTLLLARSDSVTRLSTDGKTKLLAGTQDASYAALDGDGDAARYVRPGLLAADTAGNVYSAEDVSNFYKLKTVIRKTTPAGKVSTYATLNLGMDISGMLVTPAGQLVVSLMPPGSSNTFGGGVYRVEADNKFTLIAGVPVVATNTPQQQDGSGAAARFGGPTLAGVDGGGNLYVRDRASAIDASTTVRKITPQAVVSTIAALPAGLNAAPDGNSYQLDPATPGAIYRVTPAGVKTIVAGTDSAAGIVLGALPGQLTPIRSVVPLGGNSLAVATESTILKVVLPK